MLATYLGIIYGADAALYPCENAGRHRVGDDYVGAAASGLTSQSLNLLSMWFGQSTLLICKMAQWSWLKLRGL